ncbi:TonB-dependent receptor [Spongiibacter nanhainus]|uniref:TonB-dependent receptor n=1 Tax=Spongiibacter nanhainus TaxID=2794344 RepID=A0A7T4UQD4_9GAMM|nr:TonB-dependent receptor [Spongiibacter nanhainus]QQD18576.1 TonB-dependent receptor [Spongiibacter nanhainus]
MKKITLLTSIVTFIALPNLSVAQEEAPKRVAQLEEVVVTARKRSESQQDVPVAVTAISSEQMAANNIATIADVAKIAPSLDQREGRKQGGFSIRGVGQVRINEVQADPGVAVYMDGIFLARNDSQLLDTVAIENVQVLRGPQGTLFGKNSVGGAIIVTTKDPAEETMLSFSSKLDTLGQRNATISLDLPLIEDRLLSKFTFGSVKSDGYAEDLDTGAHMGDDDRLMAALQLYWRISDNMSMKSLAYFNDQDENIPPHYCQQITLNGALSYARAPGRPEAYHEACSNAERLIGQEKVQTENYGNEFVSQDALFGNTLTWDFESGTLKSITSYVLKGDNFSDFDFDATDLLAIRNTAHVRNQLKEQGVYSDEGSRYTLGQELQYSGLALQDRLTYTVGLFASWESLDRQLEGQSSTREGWVGFESLPGLPNINMLCGLLPEDCLYVRGVNNTALSSYDNTSYAAFSQVIYDITPTLHLTAGLRYSYEQREIRVEQFEAEAVPPVAGIVPLPPGTPITVMTETMFNNLEGMDIQLSRGEIQRSEIDFERLSPMISLSWDASEHFQWNNVDALMIYGSVSEGFKSGGFNVLSTGIDSFDPEFVVSSEIGFKLDALQRSMRLNMALYNSDYKDIQVVVADIPSLGAPEIFTNNAGLARMRGVEAELMWLLSHNWVINASGNFIDAEFLEYDDTVNDPVTGTPGPVDRSDEPFPFIPEFVYNLSVNYSREFSFGLLDFVLSRNTRSEQFIGGDAMAGLPQFRDDATIKGFSTWSARASWIPRDNRDIRVSIYGNNITNKEYVATGSAVYSGFGTNSITMGKEAHFGLDFKYGF